MTTITIPLDVAEAAAEALGNFVSDHGWSDSDMQAMDNLDAYIARHRANQAARAELAKPTLAPAWHDAPETIALKAERDAAMKDAERYRYLCGQPHWSEALEKAIDAAVAKAEGEKS